MSIFYEIIAPNGQKSYLLGTLHDPFDEVTTLPKEIKIRLDNAHTCIFEGDFLQNEEVLQDKKRQLISKWNTAHEHQQIPTDYIPRAIKILKENLILQIKNSNLSFFSKLIHIWRVNKNLPKEVRGIPPIALANMAMSETKINLSLTSKIKSKQKHIFDAQLLHYASNKGKSLVFLETAEDQYKAKFGLQFDLSQHFEFLILYYKSVKKAQRFLIAILKI